MKRSLILILLAIMVLVSCRKENSLSTDPSHKLVFSVDTVMFDTVFTTLGSSTHHLLIYNPYHDDLNVSEIRLMGGEQSRFKINLDGETGVDFHDKIIPANDSIYTFLNVTIDPNDQSNPFVVEDSIMFVTNGNVQTIHLVAWGQNARYIVADHAISGYPEFKIVADSLETTHWTNELPYVIYGYALINSYGTLHIHEGTHIYVHGGGGIWSWSDGQLIIEGTAENPVIIEGDRLEPFYKKQPGQWDRIWIMDGRPGADNMINHAIIRNGFIGIQAESFLKATQSALRINNTVIENQMGWGVLGRAYAIEANNVVIDNCKHYAFEVQLGGDYLVRHSTIGNYWWQDGRSTASLFFSNYVDQDGERYEFPFHFEMGNSIVYGALTEEFGTDFSAIEVDTTYSFDHCLFKTEKYTNADPGFNSCLFNQDPLFVDYRTFDMRLSDALSPAVGAGSPLIAAEVPFDLNGHSRVGTPDLGAYQYQP